MIWHEPLPGSGRPVVVPGRSSLVQLIFTLALALLLSALTVHFRDIRDLLVEPADVLVLRDADHLSVLSMPTASRGSSGSFNLNPFFHLAVSYQEILFFHGPFGPSGAGCS